MWVEGRRYGEGGTEGCGQGLVWRRAGQLSSLKFKAPSLHHYFSYPQLLGSSGCQQQGFMGLVVFSVRGSGQGRLEVR